MALWQVWGGGLLAVLVMMTATWGVSVARHDVSLVDRVWGLAFVVLAWTYAVLGDGTADLARRRAGDDLGAAPVDPHHGAQLGGRRGQALPADA